MEAAAQPIIVKQGGGFTTGGAIAIVGGLALAAYFGKKWYDQHEKNMSEEEMDTPAGQIVLQLKTVFESTPVNDAEYKRVALQITPDLKDDVYKLYRKATTRNLSDDIAIHITAGTQTTTAKQEAINNTSGSLITITPDDKIKFNVGAGSVIRLIPGSTSTINLYPTPLGIALNIGAIPLKPTAKQFLVTAVQEVPVDGVKEATGWTKYVKPLVKTRQVYAAVQIKLPIVDPKTKKKNYIRLWADARLFRTGTGANYLKGLGCACQKLNLGLVA